MIAVTSTIMHEAGLDVVDMDPEAKLERVDVVNEPLPTTVEHDESPVVIDAPLLEPTAESHARKEKLGCAHSRRVHTRHHELRRSRLVTPIRLRIARLADVDRAPGRGVGLERPVHRFEFADPVPCSS